MKPMAACISLHVAHLIMIAIYMQDTKHSPTVPMYSRHLQSAHGQIKGETPWLLTVEAWYQNFDQQIGFQSLVARMLKTRYDLLADIAFTNALNVSIEDVMISMMCVSGNADPLLMTNTMSSNHLAFQHMGVLLLLHHNHSTPIEFSCTTETMQNNTENGSVLSRVVNALPLCGRGYFVSNNNRKRTAPDVDEHPPKSRTYNTLGGVCTSDARR